MNKSHSPVRWLWRYFKKIGVLFSIAIIFYITSIILDLSIVGIQKVIIDDVFIASKTDDFILILLAFLFIVIFEIIFFSIYEVIIEKCKSIIEISMRSEYMCKLLGISIVRYKQARISEIHSRLNDYIQSARFITETLPKVIGILANILLLVVAIGFIHPFMIVMAGLTSFLYFLIARHFGVKIFRKRAEVNDAKAELNVRFEESITSTREIVAYHRQKWELGRIEKEYYKYLMRIKSELGLRNRQLLCREPINWIVNITVLGYGGYLVITDHIAIGSFIVMYQFVDRLILNFQDLYLQFTGISSQLAAIEKGALTLTDLDKQVDQNAIANFPENIQTIEYKKVNFGYSSDIILKDLSFSLPVYKKVAIVGASGSGKSTLIHLLAKIYEPNQGELLINGTPLTQISSNNWFDRTAIVFQEPYFYPVSILENLLMGRNIPMEEVMRITKLTLIHDTIELLPYGYHTILGEQGITLSGGQRQRLAIARALLRAPELLILDESTSALDVGTERQLQMNIDTLRKDRTTVLVAHRLSTIENADIIYVMNQGSIVESGSHSELVEKSSYYRSLFTAEKRDERSISNERVWSDNFWSIVKHI